MEKAYFNNISNQIVKLLDNSTDNVKVAMAWFTSHDLFDSLLSCLNRGVKVELILLDDVINWQTYAPDFNEYIENGGIIHVADISHGFMHHKFCIIDDETIITGSYNWTYYAEIRNLENVIITQNKSVVKQYDTEFSNLANAIDPAKECKRLEISEISHMDDVDFNALNSEIKCIAQKQNKSFERIVQSDTIVKIVEERFNPVAACDIGIVKCTEEEDFVFDVFIKKGSKLPCTKTRTFYNYPEDREESYCAVLYGEITDIRKEKPLLYQELKDLTNNNKDDTLKFQIQMTLNTNGYLHIEVKCVETGKAVDLTKNDPNLVKYEK